MNKTILFIGFILIFFCQFLSAQTLTLKNNTLMSIKSYNIPITHLNPPSLYKLPNYYVSSLGVFCKAELQLQKQIAIPIKFRLGTLQYCDTYEGKH